MLEGYTLATGKTSLPSLNSTKYNRLYSLCKKFHRDWCYEKGTDWNSLSDTISAGNVTATDTFDLDADTKVIRLSQREDDYVQVTTTDNTINFIVKNASRLSQGTSKNYVSKVGQSIRFSRAFTSTDQEFGGAITVPAYLELEEITSVNDDVMIDNPAWLPVIVAAQYVLSDAQLSYQYPDLIEQANDLMDGMKLDNEPQNESYNTGESFFDVGGIC